VNSAASDAASQPIWARADAFPPAPAGWGWVDHKSRHHVCESEEQLLTAISEDRDARVILVWTPETPHMILPEEVPGAISAVLTSRKRTAGADLTEAHDRLRWFGFLLGGLCLYLLYQGWVFAPGTATASERLLFALRVPLRSMSMGITLLMFLIFAFIPWYQARKRLRECGHWSAGDVAAAVPALRFETWLANQKAPVTRLMLGLITLVGIAQLLPGDSLRAAALIKPAYLGGEWWRLFTAPFLHGNLIHFMMNAAALLYLGKRMEVFARWPHVPLVFLFAACVGGEASARFLTATSVGASGGLMGWLGFLLVFESLHGNLVPRSSRRRLIAGVLLTALIGLVGYRFIDNAAHAGGMLAGMLYAAIVFPKSSSPKRPNSTVTDRIAGIAAIAVLAAAAAFAVLRMVFHG
jgi:membrane associated rhomboid family serine protease